MVSAARLALQQNVLTTINAHQSQWRMQIHIQWIWIMPHTFPLDLMKRVRSQRMYSL